MPLNHNLQNQIKRQREWVYLAHYLAVQGLDPVHIISGLDDGYEPDFTLIFWENNQLVYIGIELTTLPRLRTQMSEKGLITKRWYWLSLLVAAKQQSTEDQAEAYQSGEYRYLHSERFKIPMKTLVIQSYQFITPQKNMRLSRITQKDVNTVMQKKASKIEAYQSRRPLNEIWLLIHTDKYQPDSILTADKDKLTGQNVTLKHNSQYDKIHITCYPSYKVLNVEKDADFLWQRAY